MFRRLAQSSFGAWYTDVIPFLKKTQIVLLIVLTTFEQCNAEQIECLWVQVKEVLQFDFESLTQPIEPLSWYIYEMHQNEENILDQLDQFWFYLYEPLVLSLSHFVCLHSRHVYILLYSYSFLTNCDFLGLQNCKHDMYHLCHKWDQNFFSPHALYFLKIRSVWCLSAGSKPQVKELFSLRRPCYFMFHGLGSRAPRWIWNTIT